MQFGFRWQHTDGQLTSNTFLEIPRGRCPKDLRQTKLTFHTDPADCETLAERLLCTEDGVTFAELLQQVFRAGWHLGRGEEQLADTTYKIHVWTVTGLDPQDVLEEEKAIVTADGADAFETLVRADYDGVMIGVKMSTWGLSFLPSAAGRRKSRLLVRLLGDPARKRAFGTIVETTVEAALAAYRSIAIPVLV